jgi:hypothetical protein
MSKVFISGSISTKTLPNGVLESLKKIQNNNMTILVGDADGIDKVIQDYFKRNNYDNVHVYSIYSSPRNLSSKTFQTKLVNVAPEITKERERQTHKDKAMSVDSDYSLVVWDGKSRGSHKNIIRALSLDKKVKVYLSNEDQFIEPKRISKNEIDFIFYENNGYSAKEVVDYLNNEGKNYFKNTRALNKFLIDKKIIEKQDEVYVPLKNHDLFIIEKYRGKISGIKFKNSFIDWLESTLDSKAKQVDLF